MRFSQHIPVARVAEIRAMETQQATSRRRLDDLFASLLHRAYPGGIVSQAPNKWVGGLLRGESVILVGEEIPAMKEQLTAVFQEVPEGYIAFVEELPGANTQGETLEEARTNLQEAVQLILEANRALAEETLRNKTVIREPLASIS